MTAAVIAAQTPKPAPSTPAPQNPPKGQTTFRTTANHFDSVVKVVNSKGQFVPDLRQDEFRVFEDGVEQKIDVFLPNIGGRTMTAAAAAPPPAVEGLIFPQKAPAKMDEGSRIFVIFIDDLHIQTADTMLTRNVLRIMRDTLLHEGDLISLVSTGYSAIESDHPEYDYHHVRLNEAIEKLMGSGMTPEETINATETADGPAGLRYRVDTAFRTAYDILTQLEQVQDRRKAFIYISSGYDLNPFKDSRLEHQQQLYNFMNTPGSTGDSTGPGAGSAQSGALPPSQAPLGSMQADNPFAQVTAEFSEADLIREIAELIRAAQRANTVFYTVDPRGLTAAPGAGSVLSVPEWNDFVRTSTTTLQVLAEQTGGLAGVNSNDFKGYFQRVDNDFSDWYTIGYTSTNPDPLRKTRKLEVRVTRPGLTIRQSSPVVTMKPMAELKPKDQKTLGRGGRGGEPPRRVPEPRRP